MPYVLVRHKVQDYAKWKPVFDEHGVARKASGSKGGQLFRNADDPNDLAILLEWDDVKKARQFVQSEELKQAMQRAGVSGPPEILFLDELARPSA
jgi:heme-degrading monooxygenase HmoA